MKIIVTGGNGYLGAKISDNLADQGHQVIPICRNYIKKNNIWHNKMYSILDGDITDPNTIINITNLKPEVIIHTISLDHNQSENTPEIINKINVLPTWNLINTNNNLIKFIYISTTQVYGQVATSTLINEKSTVCTTNNYALTHYLCENILNHFNRNSKCDIISIRLSNSYGAPVFIDNNCWWLIVNDLCKNAFLNKEIRILSDGSPMRDFIHVNDVCNAITLLIKKEKNLENIYNLSSGETLSIIEIAKIIQKKYFNKYKILIPIYNSNGLIDYDIKYQKKYIIDNNKFKNIGFKTEIDIETGIGMLFTYFENNKF